MNHDEKLDKILEYIERAGSPVDFPIQISSTMPWSVDYHNRKHLFIWSPVNIILTLEDYGTLTVSASNWQQLDMPPGMRVFSNNVTPIYIYGKATDEYEIDEAGILSTNSTIIAPVSTPADATTNPSNIVSVEDFLMGFNGTTWDRLRAFQQVLSVANDIYTYTPISTNTTTLVKSGSGALHTITVNNPGSSWIATVYDNTSATGTPIAVIAFVAGLIISLDYDVRLNTGLTIVTCGTTPGHITVASR